MSERRDRFTPALRLALLVTALVAAAEAASAAPVATGASGQPIPRFVALGANEVNMRAGPDRKYPVEWVYRRRGMPVEVLQEYGIWRRIRDVEGVQGWVNGHLLSGERGAIVVGQTRLLRVRPEDSAPGVWRVEPGVVARIVLCEGLWCQLNIGGKSGWIRREEFWGSYPDENFD